MSEILPIVRYLILCDDVQTDDDGPRRVTLVGLIGTLRSLEDPSYPILKREFCAYLQLAECRGAARCRIDIQHADSGDVIYRTRTRIVPLTSDPLEVVGVTLRLRDCLFPEPGLYWVQFWYNDRMLAQQPLILR